MLSKKKFVRSMDAISGRLHDELVMMDIEKGKYFSLNPIATRIWDLLEHPKTMAALFDLLQEEYDVAEAQFSNEAGDFLEEMVRLGLVKER